ncbi:MAG: aminotransferase class III-fold pyridoxal phosphate-dependent enzyme [Pseudomonadota bacterium]
MCMTDEALFWRDALSAHWPIGDAWQTLAGEFDLNFRDEHRVYKVMRADCDDALVGLQVDLLAHLAGSHALIPKLVPTQTGASIQRINDADGKARLCWSISALHGELLVHSSPVDIGLSREIGAAIARLHRALDGFAHPMLQRKIKWDLREVLSVRDASRRYATHPLRDTLDKIFSQQTKDALSALSSLSSQAIHNDLNDHNLLCRADALGPLQLTGIIDFGDAIEAPRIVDLAIAAAYLVLNTQRPFEQLFALVAGYTSVIPLDDTEVGLVWPLLLTRLAQSAVNAWDSAGDANDDYLQVSQAPITDFLATHGDTMPAFVEAGLRRSAGRPPAHQAAREWVAANAHTAFPIFNRSLAEAPVLDLWVAGDDTTDNPVTPDLDQLTKRLLDLAPEDQPVLGKYREARLVYGAPFYLSGDHGATDRRTIHIAIDVFLPAGTTVYAPLDAVVHSAEVCDAEFDYGGLVVLKHTPAEDVTFYTLYGHLTHASAATLSEGQAIKRGEPFAQLGPWAQNGGWPPHVHFQLGMTDAPGSAWPGVVDPDLLDDWQTVFPDPAALLGVADSETTGAEPEPGATHDSRVQHSPPSLRLSYEQPLQIVRGWKSLLFDERGRTYLDAYNNVPHVGHSHPRVRAAVERQLRFINTNTRYLQPIHAAYTEALCARLPAPLSVCFLLSSGSEANELALRLARAHTGSNETIALKAGYHGHTVTTIEISDYKFSGPGGEGAPDWVHIVNNPDTYRFDAPDDNAGAFFAEEVASVIATLAQDSRHPGCFIAETFPSVGGQVVPPRDYLHHVYRHVRAAGGICIADEVQTGLGRLGEYFWGFEHQNVTPDIVVLGKPIGNGYPLAAVITTPEIAASFDTGMEFFATFGGASAACAAGLEVLSIIDDEQLAERAANVGHQLLHGLRSLASAHPVLADVRGEGLFIGVECADADKRPLPEVTRYIVNRLRDRRVLIGSDGPHHNVLKIRPPLAFTAEDAAHFLYSLSTVLSESALQTYR